MSEYQYYEFQAVDRPLTMEEMRVLRSYSTRATITPTRFTNHYEWGSFKGDPSAWMEKYFDAFFYFANWNSYELMFRLPRQALDLDVAKQYCRGETARARGKGEFVILEFLVESDEYGDGSDDGSGWLSSLLPLRADLANGDYRMLYLAWLSAVQADGLDEKAAEPPAPPGLGTFSAPLQTFAEFLGLSPDLIAAAAAGSPPLPEAPSEAEVSRWVSALPEAEKTAWLLRLVGGQEAHLRADLLKAFRGSQGHAGTTAGRRRRVGELREAAERLAEARKTREAERAARERQRREREAAAARERRLEALAKREAEAWREVDALIATMRPVEYDKAVALLRDLAELGARSGRQAEIRARLAALRQAHGRKSTLIARFQAAGLLAE